MTGRSLDVEELVQACPVGCGRTVAPGRIVCDTCWKRTRHGLRDEMFEAVAAMLADDRDPKVAIAYRDARHRLITEARDRAKVT